MSGGAPREDEAKALVRRLIDSVFNARDSGALAELAQDAEGAWRSAVGVLVELAAFPDYVLAVDDLIREGDRVAARITVRGTHAGRLGAFPPSGRPVTATMIAVFHVAGGKIVDGWHSWDRGSAAGQLDAIPEPVLELADIQGNIVPGFRKDHSALLFLRIGDVDAARAWLGKLASIVATADEVLAFNRLFSAARRRRRFEGALRATWVNVAFTAPGLARLVPDAALVADAPFHEGMHARAPLLGDPSPAGWVVGAPELLPDVLVIVGSDSEADLDAQLRQLEPGEGGGLEVLRVERGATLPGDLAGHEHYGFKDGISQPGLRGLASATPGDYLTPRQNPGNPGEARPGEPLVWPGEFVFGYPRQDPYDPSKPGQIADGGPSWTRNGSLLVFRRYRQDVSRFRDFLASTARALSGGAGDVSPDLAAAKLVGRWRSGAPIVRAADADNPELAASDCAANNFAYATARPPIPPGPPGTCADPWPPAPADPRGVLCPHGGHIRKAYPRDEVPGAQSHRLLRRGTPFGPVDPPEAERGLLFLCYQTSIEQQFEYVLRNWVNFPDFATPGAGVDPIIGSRANSGATFSFPAADGGAATSIHTDLDWTTMTGGGYFFVPSVGALRTFGG